MERGTKGRTRISVKESIETNRLREETQNVEHEQELTPSSQMTSKALQTSSICNLYSVAREALDTSQQEEPLVDVGQDTRETLRSHYALSAETKA